MSDPVEEARQKLSAKESEAEEFASQAFEAEENRANLMELLEEAQEKFSEADVCATSTRDKAIAAEKETQSLRQELEKLIHTRRTNQLAVKERIIRATFKAQMDELAAEKEALEVNGYRE